MWSVHVHVVPSSFMSLRESLLTREVEELKTKLTTKTTRLSSGTLRYVTCMKCIIILVFVVM